MADVPDLIDFVESACAEANIHPDSCFDLALALEEAASNVIEHGYRGSGGLLAVRFIVTGRDVTIELRDQAKPFKPKKVSPPDTQISLEDQPLGGLGLHLMYQLMDEVRFETLADGNLLTMVKRGVA